MNPLIKSMVVILIIVLVIGLIIGIYIKQHNKAHNTDVNTISNTTVQNVKTVNKIKEKFSPESCNCDDPSTTYSKYKSAISIPTGVSYPIEYSADNSTNETIYYKVKNYNTKTNIYEYLMVEKDNTGSSILSVGANNITGDNSQLWKIEKVIDKNPTTTAATTETTPAATTETTDSSSVSNKYYFVSAIDSNYVLQYENGYISIRPKDNYDHQFWILSESVYDKGLAKNIDNDYVNIPPASRNLLSSSGSSGINTDLYSANQQKLNNVLQAIASSLQQLNNAKSSQSVTPFGYSMDNPIKINLTMAGSGISASNTEAFTNLNKNNMNNDVLSLLDKYESSDSNNTNNINALSELIAKNGGCQAIDMSKYINKRVGQCNCNLSK